MNYWDRSLTRREAAVAAIGWIGLAAYVVAWDRHASVTLSRGWGHAMEHPIAGPAIILAWGLTTAHLFGRRPRDLSAPWRWR